MKLDEAVFEIYFVAIFSFSSKSSIIYGFIDEANKPGQIPTYTSIYLSVPHALQPKRGFEQFVNGHPITKLEPEKKKKNRKTQTLTSTTTERKAYQQTESLSLHSQL